MISIEPLKLHPRFCHVLPYERKWLCIQYQCKRSAKGRMNQKSSALYWEWKLPSWCAICENWTLENNCCNPQLHCLLCTWSSLTQVCDKLVGVTRKVSASFTVLYFLDPQLLTLRMSGSKYLLNIFELSSLIQDLLCLAGTVNHAMTFWGEAELPGWKY